MSKQILFVGTHLGHAITNKIHDEVATSLDLDWRLTPLDTLDLDEFDKWSRDDSFGGAVITLPHKLNIISHLDRVDELVGKIGACNNVYRSDGGLIGTNTDWIGVRDSLRSLEKGEIDAKVGFVIGAGGAARAAIYALSKLGCAKIYVINRDAEEVERLRSDVEGGYKSSRHPPNIIHLLSISDIEEPPTVGVGTVPDFEPVTASEQQAQTAFVDVLKNGTGLFLDMCYKPRHTRNLRLAQQHGWKACEGVHVVTHQLRAQWRLWVGEELSRKIPMDKMADRISQIADELARDAQGKIPN